MCGLAGIFSFDRDGGSQAVEIYRMLELVSRRGPDDHGCWSDGDGFMLGFRRLSVLDLSPAGHQPLVSPDGRFVLACNGEIYNFRELAHLLEQDGVRMRSTGDAEVVLHALIRWGRDALARFNGMFALAFFDRARKLLLLARDHMGMKPLYVLQARRGVAFGSQYDQLRSHPWGQSRELVPSSLGLYLRFDHVPAPYAMHEGFGMLEPGEWLEVERDGTTRRGRHFEFPGTRSQVHAAPDLSGTQAVEAVEEALKHAVARHMVSDVPLGTFLSGGIDSPLIASIAQASATAPLPAFTLGLPGSADDEAADARFYASELGLAHVVRDLTEEEILPLVDEASDACAEPFADFSIIPTLLIAREARRRVTVMLCGDGGDELFWGYVQRAASTLRIAPAFRRPRWWRALSWAARPGSREPGLLESSLGAWYADRHQFVRTAVLRRLFPDLPAVPTDFDTFRYEGWEADRAARWMRGAELRLHLPRVLMKVDRASMYHSLEVRMPLLDREVVDVAARIDWRSCLDLGRGVGKLPLRHALARRLKHQTGEKRGFTVPMDAWMRGVLREPFEDIVLGRGELAAHGLRTPALRALWREHQQGTASHGWLLWRLFALARWFERDRSRAAAAASPPATAAVVTAS